MPTYEFTSWLLVRDAANVEAARQKVHELLDFIVKGDLGIEITVDVTEDVATYETDANGELLADDPI